MFYKECFTTFVASLRKTLTTNKLERTKVEPEELPFLPASFMSFYQKRHQVSSFFIKLRF